MITPKSIGNPCDSMITNFLRYPFGSAEIIQSDDFNPLALDFSMVMSYHESGRRSSQILRDPCNIIEISPDVTDMFQFLKGEPVFGFDRRVLPMFFDSTRTATIDCILYPKNASTVLMESSALAERSFRNGAQIKHIINYMMN